MENCLNFRGTYERKQTYIAATARVSNSHQNTDDYRRIEAKLLSLGIHPVKLVIDPLRVPWNDPVEDNHFRSGCAPIQAIAKAKELIESGTAKAVVIEGDEPLRTGYDRDERHRLMGVYGDNHTIP